MKSKLEILKELRLSLDLLTIMIMKMIKEEERQLIEKKCREDKKSEE